MSWRLRRGCAALLAALTSLVVAGCSGVPTSGPIVQGEQFEPANRPNAIRVIVSPPSRGLDPAAIVSGFLEASASAESDHAIARQYLTASAAARWRGSAVRVLENAPLNLVSTGEGRVLMTAKQSGSISDDGSRTVQPTPTAFRHDFRLEKVEGEWRISNPPDEVLLTESDIERSFRPFSIYFLDPSGTRLVPDVRMLPAGASPGPVSLMRALLAGPSEWLGSAVTTAVPQGTGLRLDSVPVDGGVASVELTSEAAAAEEGQRRAMAAQIVWTLTRLANVNGAVISIGGVPMRIDTASFVLDRAGLGSFNPDSINISVPLASLVEGRPVRQTGSREEQLAQVSRNAWTDLAVGSAGAYVVGVADAGKRVEKVFFGGSAQTIFSGKDLAAPSIDLSGAIWVTEGGQRLVRIAADGTASASRPQGLPAGARILGSAISRDGARIALIVATSGSSVVMLGRVVPTVDGTVVEGLRRLEADLSDAVDVAWADSDTLALLSGATGDRRVGLLDLETQSVQSLEGPPAAVQIAAAPGRELVVATTQGVIWALRGGQWQAVGAGVHPAYPS